MVHTSAAGVKERIKFVLDTSPVGTSPPNAPWIVRAYLRDNTLGTWAEVDAGNGPKVGRPGVSFGHAVIAVGGYTAGSGILNVDSTVGDPPFQGAPPVTVSLGNPNGGPIFATLTVTGINTPTQFAVAPVVDGNAPAGTGVFQTSGSGNVLLSPFGCPTYIRDTLDPDVVLIGYSDLSLSRVSWMPFNLSTKAFGAEVTGGPVAYGNDLVSAGRNWNDDTGAKVLIGVRPQDNRIVFHFQGAPETVGPDRWIRSYFVTYDRGGGGWSAPTIVTGTGEALPFAPVGLVVDPATGMTHLFVEQPPNGLTPGVPVVLNHVSVSLGGAFSARDTITNLVSRIREPMVGYPFLRAGSSELLIPWVDNAQDGFRKARVSRGSLAAVMTWTTEDVSTTLANGPNFDNFVTPNGGVGDDGQPYIFWLGAADPDFAYRLFYSKGGDVGTGWAAPTALFVVPDPNNDFMERPNVSVLPGIGFGIVVEDASISDAIVGGVESHVYFELALPCDPGSLLADCVSSLLIYDQNKVPIASAPVLDIYCDGSPESPIVHGIPVSNAPVYGDGAIVPPLYYEKDSQIQIDFYSQIESQTTPPVVVDVYLVGKQYYPC